MDTKTQAICNEIASQRDQALNMVCSLKGELADRDEKIAALTKELEALKTPQPTA